MCDNYYFLSFDRTSKYNMHRQALEWVPAPYTNMETHWPVAWSGTQPTHFECELAQTLERIISWTILINLWRTSCKHPNIDMHTTHVLIETHWPVHLKRTLGHTLEREAAIRDVIAYLWDASPRFAGTLGACQCTNIGGASSVQYEWMGWIQIYIFFFGDE